MHAELYMGIWSVLVTFIDKVSAPGH